MFSEFWNLYVHFLPVCVGFHWCNNRLADKFFVSFFSFHLSSDQLEATTKELNMVHVLLLIYINELDMLL